MPVLPDKNKAQANQIIKKYEERFASLSDQELLLHSSSFRNQLSTQVWEEGVSLPPQACNNLEEKAEVRVKVEQLLPQAFALVREAAYRELGYRHYLEQLMGGLVLHQGQLVEMQTGEGKTLTITAPAYLTALSGRGVHVVTANDYLAQRDCSGMGRIYARLGISCAVITATEQFIFDPTYSVKVAHQLVSTKSNHPFLRPCQRREAYQAEITYGTASAFGFDYLRDRLVRRKEDLVQRELHFAILDEVDNILLDEARTPLIISGPTYLETKPFYQMMELVRRLVPEQDYEVELAHRTASFTEKGIAKLEKWLGINSTAGQTLYDDEHASNLYYLDNCLKALTLYKSGEDYLIYSSKNENRLKTKTDTLRAFSPASSSLVVSEWLYFVKEEEGEQWSPHQQTLWEVLPGLFGTEKTTGRPGTADLHQSSFNLATVSSSLNRGEVVLIDKVTGRPMPGRRFSNGLHEALEAKEGLVIQPATTTIALISLHAYFRQYQNLAGLSGTLFESQDTLYRLYGLETVVIPPHKPVQRIDAPPQSWLTQQSALGTLMDDVVRVRQSGAPILIGVPSVTLSEEIARKLAAQHIPYQLLNARQTQHEAQIIAKAGYPGRVTIATNLAGRGTDILLGGRYEDHLSDLAKQQGLIEIADKGTLEWRKLEHEARARHNKARQIVFAAGGLHVFGLGLQTSRRLDRQLVGRAGRQGDPGYSRFYFYLEDPLVEQFAGGSAAYQRLLRNYHKSTQLLNQVEQNFNDHYRASANEEGATILSSQLALQLLQECQRKAEGQQLDLLTQGIQFDEVLNRQRELFYRDRQTFLLASTQELDHKILQLSLDQIGPLIHQCLGLEITRLSQPDMEPFSSPVPINLKLKWQVFTRQLIQETALVFGKHIATKLSTSLMLEHHILEVEELEQKLVRIVEADYKLVQTCSDQKERLALVREEMLKILDRNWVAYLTPLEELRRGIGLRVYGGQKPLHSYQNEARKLWEEFQAVIRLELVKTMWHQPWYANG